MCLQDYQLSRAIFKESVDWTAAVASTVLVLPRDPARVGFVITGFASATGIVYFNTGSGTRVAAQISISSPWNDRWFSLVQHGPIITDEVYVSTAIGQIFNVTAYTLPVGRSDLLPLAEFGKVGKS